MARSVTNKALDALLFAAGYGNAHAAFARQVNHAGRAQGIWRYDAASVYWWLRGRRPAEHVQIAMAETIARKLSRPVEISELGFVGTDLADAAYPSTAGGAIDAAGRLWTLLAHRVNSPIGGVFHSGAALQAAFAWRYDLPDPQVTRDGRPSLTAADIQPLHLLAGHFADLDRRHGGGSPHTRALMADLLARQVIPMLHGAYADAVGRDLMRATAALCGQLAFMSYDAGEHGIAQHHVTIALRLAKAADDRLYGAHLLANLATQATYLGSTRDAARLAEAAVEGAGRAPAAVRARLYTTAASAYGRSGERRACRAALAKAERAVDRMRKDESPQWVSYFSPAHLAGATLKCLSDLRLHRQALRHASDAVTLASPNARTRALHSALIALTHAQAGDIEAACTWGREAARHASQVSSARVTQRVQELTAVLNPHRAMADVHDLLSTLAPVPSSRPHPGPLK
ncbi:hypothetical protein AB0I90_10675 [Micromonospora wenchangensis]|uniref:hypothetical protein n=1 Tax=Micromonospora wenchangensis TaxID=1185415 RepID=UPI001182B8B9|nr:hypothetical protein [Micromonospora wenchangensis]